MKLALALVVAVSLGLPISGQLSDGRFGNLSERARHVLLVSVRESQQRGADTVNVNDLIVALIIEDQEPDAVGLFDETPSGGVPLLSAHKPFLPAKIAIDVLVKMNGILPRSRSLPPTTELHTSVAFDRVFDAAKNMPSEFHQSEVQINVGSPDHPIGMYQAVVPLDLFAAALREPCEGTKFLQAAGITEEKVLQRIRAGGDLEKGTSSETQ